MNLSQLRTQIDRRTRVRQDIPAANSFINEAINIISSRREWPWLDAVQTITTTDGENSYDVASTYSETRTLNVNGFEARQIYIADGDDFDQTAYAPCDGGYDYSIEWSLGEAKLLLYPTPPADTTLIHRYTRTEALLVTDNSSPLMPERYHSIIADMAAGMFLESINPARADYYRGMAERGLKQMSEGVQRKTNPGRIRIRDGAAY